MVKYITKDRLSDAGRQAALAVLKQHQGLLKLSGDANVALDCKYIGTAREDEPLRSNTQVVFHWIVGDDTTNPFEQRTLAGKLLHCDSKPQAPRQLKIHLLCSLLPEAIVERRLVPAMLKVANGTQIRCRGLALAKEHVAQYETTFLNVKYKRAEHVKLARISGKKWLVHPGTVLSTAEIFTAAVEEEPSKKNNPIVERIEPIPRCELRSKLFAVASFQAELLRAKEERRAVDTGLADVLFDKDSSKWTRLPKQVFVLWSSQSSDGGEEHHATEVMFSTLFKGRL